MFGTHALDSPFCEADYAGASVGANRQLGDAIATRPHREVSTEKGRLTPQQTPVRIGAPAPPARLTATRAAVKSKSVLTHAESAHNLGGQQAQDTGAVKRSVLGH
jgi:hypothetical protein